MAEKLKNDAMSWICIDFGTCNSAAAIAIDGSPHVVSYGNQQFFPTIACILDDSKIEVCQDAQPLRNTHPETFKQEFKLQIADQLDINSVSYTDIVTEILSFIKGCAEIENNNNPIDAAVLTIPAIYTENDKRKSVMATAAKRAGFKVVEFLSEPVAAAYHYIYISGASKSGKFLIYDLGGGTFDPALLELSSKSYKLLGHDAGVKCGGNFFDKAIYRYIAERATSDGNPLSRAKRLEDYDACRRIKESLSVKLAASQIFSNGKIYDISRKKFDELISPQLNLTLQACDNLLSTSNTSWSDIRQVLLVGGSTAIPLINELLTKHLISHNAPDVKIIRNAKFDKGEYNHRFATCIGGIASKILPPPLQPEKVAVLECNNKFYQLKMGDNTFGRSSEMDFAFDDRNMSRHHFTISVTKGSDNRLNYTLTTKSQSRATIVNNLEALDARYAPISRISINLMDGFMITAGETKFVFKKPELK